MKFINIILFLLTFSYGSSNFLKVNLNTSITSEDRILPATEILAEGHPVKEIADRCPPFENVQLTQSELFTRLTNSCRYDKIQRPIRFDEGGNILPVDVFVQSFVFYMQNLDTHDMLFTLQMRFQFRYTDDRLKFSDVGSDFTDSIIGEEDLMNQLWTPHIFFINERDTGTLDTEDQDTVTVIYPDGTVIISSRMQETLYCSMEFKNFPFDQQRCSLTIGSWIYNASIVKFHWESESPFAIGSDKILTEYIYTDTTLDESIIDSSKIGLQYGDFTGNYSFLTFTINFDRSVGYYLLGYYFPSIMLVIMSWVSFWLQADQTSPRALLGTFSMLAFITLSSSETKALPKVSYVKASEIWFIGCILFIFFSLIEFAFVNLLWRREKIIYVEKVTAAKILKEALRSRNNSVPESGTLRHARSDTSLYRLNSEGSIVPNNFGHTLTVPDNSNFRPMIINDSTDDMTATNSVLDIVIPIPNSAAAQEVENEAQKTALTHQQIAILIDKRARVLFPCAFIIFNAVYWILVNANDRPTDKNNY